MPHTPINSPDYIPMISSPRPTKPSDLRMVIWEKVRKMPQGELPPRPNSICVNPVDRHLYDKPGEEEEDNKQPTEGRSGWAL